VKTAQVRQVIQWPIISRQVHCYQLFFNEDQQRMWLVHTASCCKHTHIQRHQWRSKALRGPGSTVTWGPSLSLPSTPPPLPLLFLSPAPPPAAKWPPNPAPAGDAVSSPSRVWGRAPAEIELGASYAHCSLLLVFFRSSSIIFLPKIFLWPPLLGTPGARGPRFIEPPEPPVPTPLNVTVTC